MTTQTAFSAQAFADFWADPDPAKVTTDPFVPDVVGYWPDAEVHGVEAYTRRLIVEDRIFFDTKRFEELSGYALPSV